MTIQFDTVTLPAYWATALVNNDWSGLNADEADMCRAAIERLKTAGYQIVSTVDDAEPYFTWQYRLYCPEANCSGGDVLDYVAHRIESDADTFRAVVAPGFVGSGDESKEAWHGQARADKGDRWQTVTSDYGPILYTTEAYALTAAKDLRDKLVAEPITPVIFRRVNKGHGGEIIAVFPTDAASYNEYECGCYAHVGQHSACDPWHIMRHSKLAKPAEYADLKAELEAAPYNYRLKVYTRLQRKWHEERVAELRKQGGVKIPQGGCDEREEIINRHSRTEA